MSNICCVLDACTVINLIHIDEEDFLLKKVNSLQLYINEVVFEEIRNNVYSRIFNLEIDKYSNKVSLKETRKNIEIKLSFFRGKKNDNAQLFKDVGKDFFERVGGITEYKKYNGELCSTAYALYLSRIGENKVFFFTDDKPAKNSFSPFFQFQQIGHIKDSVDLLILLFWLDEKFSSSSLDKFLSELYSQYVTQISLFKICLRNYYNEKVDVRFLKDKKELASNLMKLISKLDNLDFHSIRSLWVYFESNAKKYKNEFNLIKNFYSIFELESSNKSDTLLYKIESTRQMIKTHKIYKLGDLCDI